MINKSNQKHIHKIWKSIFAISLALNIVIIGAVGGATFKHSNNEFKGVSKLKDRQIGSFYLRALNQDQKHELRRKMRSQKINKKTIQENIEASRQETINILRSAEFDKNTFQVVFKAHSGKSLQRLEFAQKNLIFIINSMSLEERLEYADRIAKYKKPK
tara:strand:+ start:395 stop:871 length:477 start_codon:yes stop_codon:yes gene_type:complete